jgi:hypothetical protein
MDLPELERFVAIMHAIGDITHTIAKIRSWMSRLGNRVDYYHGEGFEIVLHYSYRRRHDYWLVSLGLVGRVDPQEALDLVVERCRAFAEGEGHEALYAVVPNTFATETLDQLHQLVAWHPEVELQVVERFPDSALWKMAYRS